MRIIVYPIFSFFTRLTVASAANILPRSNIPESMRSMLVERGVKPTISLFLDKAEAPEKWG